MKMIAFVVLRNGVDKRCSAVHRGVSHDGRFVVKVSEIRSEMVIQAPRHKIYTGSDVSMT